MRYKYILLSLLLLIVIFLMILFLSEEREDMAGINQTYDRVMAPSLIGKYCRGVGEVIPGINMDTSGNVIFLYNGYDCDDCIEAGFYTTKMIDSIFGKQKVLVVATMTNPVQQQTRYRYYDYIYMDEKDTIRRELNYIPTPAILYLNDSSKIIDTYFPLMGDNAGRENFIKGLQCSGDS